MKIAKKYLAIMILMLVLPALSVVNGKTASINEEVFQVIDEIYLDDHEDQGYLITGLSVGKSGKILKFYFDFADEGQQYWHRKSANVKDRFLVGHVENQPRLVMAMDSGELYEHITSRLRTMIMNLENGTITSENTFNIPLWIQNHDPQTYDPVPDQIVDSIISIIQLSSGKLLVQRTHNNIYFNPESANKITFKPHLYLNILSASGKPIQSDISTGASFLDLGILRSSDKQDNLYFVKLDRHKKTIVTKVTLNL